MSGLNKVILIGRLGRNPDIHATQSGKKCASFSIATSETWVQNGNKEEKTEWHRIVAWDKLADLSEKYLKKGINIYIEGKLQTKKYKDKNGNDCSVTETIANQFCFIESLKKEDSQHQIETEQYTSPDRPMNDDIPF
jgi:single-strand DNA-binding protein